MLYLSPHKCVTMGIHLRGPLSSGKYAALEFWKVSFRCVHTLSSHSSLFPVLLCSNPRGVGVRFEKSINLIHRTRGLSCNCDAVSAYAAHRGYYDDGACDHNTVPSNTWILLRVRVRGVLYERFTRVYLKQEDLGYAQNYSLLF